MEGAHRLRPILGPLQLTSLGVGAIIGAGIFVVIGLVAKDKAGAAILLSFVIAGFACAFAALCYAEFASMVPVAGSAYTYAYATLGELFTWIIGWDLLSSMGWERPAWRILRRRARHALPSSGDRATFSLPVGPPRAPARHSFLPAVMFSLPTENWFRLIAWLLLGIAIYFGYGKRHSLFARMRNREIQASLPA